MLSCKHIYHFNCLRQWLSTQKIECPKCKQKINLEQIQESHSTITEQEEQVNKILHIYFKNDKQQQQQARENIEFSHSFQDFYFDYDQFLQQIETKKEIIQKCDKLRQFDSELCVAATTQEQPKMCSVEYGLPVEAIIDRTIDDVIL